jgi:hypothetical protein
LIDASVFITVMGEPLTVTLDANGEFTIKLPATDDVDVSPTGFTYTVTENFTNGSSYSIAVPSSYADVGLELTSIAHVSPNAGLPGTITRADFDALSTLVDGLIAGYQGGSGSVDGGGA